MTSDQLPKLIKRHLWRHRILGYIVVFITLLVPFLAFHTSLAESSEDKAGWNIEVVRVSLQDGSFWLDPGTYLFQRPLYVDDNPVNVALSFMLVGLVTILFLMFVYHTLRGIPRLILRDKGIQGGRMFKSAELTEKMKSVLKLNGMVKLVGYDRPWLFAVEGRSLILQTAFDKDVSDLVVDARTNDLARREGIEQHFPAEKEVVLDGTTYEHFKLFLPDPSTEKVQALFSPETLALLIKQLDQADISIENNVLTVVFDSRRIKEVKDFDTIMNALDEYMKQVIDGSKSTDHFSPQTVKTYSVVTLFFFDVVRKKIIITLIAALLIGYVVVMLFIPQGATEGDLMLFETVVGWLYLWHVWGRDKHRLGPRIASHSNQDAEAIRKEIS